MSDQETLERVQDDALKLLAYRPRSRAELQAALGRKGYSEELINQVLVRLERAGWVDDAQFAALWVRQRARTKALGRDRLRWELHRKGIDRETAEAALAAEADEDSEWSRARAVAAKARSQLAGIEPPKAARRLAERLARRGFRSDLIWRVVRETFAGGEETPE
jgi:regulatory protein